LVIRFFLFRPLLRHSWFICCLVLLPLSHSLLKFLEQAESAEGDVQCGKGRRPGGVFVLLSAARIRDQLERRSSGKSRVIAFSITFGFNKIVPDDSDHLHTEQLTQDYLELT
jgi:hypothetical protein